MAGCVKLGTVTFFRPLLHELTGIFTAKKGDYPQFGVKAQAQQKSSLAAAQSATENRELNVRAYQDELVETKDVIEAQILEALLAAQYQQVLYSHMEGLAKLDMVSGADPRSLSGY